MRLTALQSLLHSRFAFIVAIIASKISANRPAHREIKQYWLMFVNIFNSKLEKVNNGGKSEGLLSGICGSVGILVIGR